MNTISVILASGGRETLQDAIDSVVGAHELHVILDNSNDFGNKVRNEWMPQCTGTHIAFLDDDDIYTPGAVQAMVEMAHPDVPSIFRMDDRDGILWRDDPGGPRFQFANFGTPTLVIPNRPELFGKWQPYTSTGRGGDWMFIQETVNKMGGPHFVDHVVAVIRPHSRGLM